MLLPSHVSLILGVAKALKTLDLKAATRIQAQFDPFHSKVQSIRDFIFYTSAAKYRETNSKCSFKTVIVDDRSEPQVKVTLASKQEIVFKTANLNSVELLKLFNKYVSDLGPKDEPTSEDLKQKQTKKIRKKRNYV